jgi:hypothetical protein
MSAAQRDRIDIDCFAEQLMAICALCRPTAAVTGRGGRGSSSGSASCRSGAPIRQRRRSGTRLANGQELCRRGIQKPFREGSPEDWGDLVLGSEDAGDYSEEECTRFSAIVVKEAFW